MNAESAIVLALLMTALGLRHITQVLMDAKRRHRNRLATCNTWARGAYVVALYLAIVTACLVAMASGQETSLRVRILGLALVYAGVALGLTSIIQLGSNYSFDISVCEGFRFVTTGVYSVVRHPMRLGLAVESLGVVLISAHTPLSLPWLGMLFLLNERTRKEEAFLSTRAFCGYTTYMLAVPRWNIIAGMARRLKGTLRRRAR